VSAACSPPRPTEPYRGLWTAFARSVRDNVMGEFAVQVIRIGGIVILARRLHPEDFGLLKVLLVVSVFATLFCEAGIPEALVQRKELRDDHESTAWWMSLGLGMLSAACLYVAAPPLAAAMEMPRLEFGARLMCVPVLLDGLAATANARLRRQLRFGALAVAETLGEAAFVAVALLVLRAGMPEWSLAGALAARIGVRALATCAAGRHLPVGLPRIAAARDLGRFALSVTGAEATIAVSANADYLLVGRLLGDRALGLYSVAWDLLRFVPYRLHRVAVRVTLPAFCRLQDDDRELARAYRGLFNYLARIVLPIIACVAVAAPELLHTLYGAQWAAAATPLRLMAAGLAVAGLREGIGSIYYAKDHPAFDIYLNALRFILIVAAVLSLAGGGLFAISAGMSVVEGLTSVIGVRLACELLNLNLRGLIAAAVPGLRLAVACAIVSALGKAGARAANLDTPAVAAIAAFLPAIVFCWVESAAMSEILARAFGRTRLATLQGATR